MVMPISFFLQQQDQEEVPDIEAEDSQTRDDIHAPEVKMERSPLPLISPPSPPLHATAATPADTPGPSYTAQHSPEHIHVSSRELVAVMDAICSPATTQAAQDQRLARAEATLGHCHYMLQQIMTHLGIQHVLDQRDEPTAATASLDMLAAAAAATDPPPPQE